MQSKYLHILILTLMSSLVGYGQTEKIITGKLTDQSGDVVIGASVLLKNEAHQIVTYAISDKYGKYELVTSVVGRHTLSVSHISYATYTEKITFSDTVQIIRRDMVLRTRSNDLDEVVIQERTAVVEEHGDTLSYKLKSLMTGRENKLKDIIKKLPGLEITSGGKIKHNGKVVDNLLVNGKPFFGDNHEITTNNMSARIVGGIDLIKDYQKFEGAKGIEGSGETAINIKIKEKYQGRPTGNAEAYGAYQERYRLHTNLFSFAKKYNLGFVGDLNNIGEQAISVMEFFQIDKSKDIQNSENRRSSIGGGAGWRLPSFMMNHQNSTVQNSKFGALNLVFMPFKRVVVEAFGFVNNEKVKAKQFSERLYFSERQNISNRESINKSNKLLLGKASVNIDYKPSRNNLWTYTATYKPNRNIYGIDIDGSIAQTYQNITQLLETKGHTLGQSIGYATRLSDSKLLNISVFSNQYRELRTINLVSNQSLFKQGNTIDQQTKNTDDKYGVYARYTQRIRKHVAKVSVGHVWNVGEFYHTKKTNQDTPFNQKNYWYAVASIEKKKGFFQYKALLNMRNYNLAYDQKKQQRLLFLPSIHTHLQFSSQNRLSFNYARKIGFPTAKQLNLFSYATDYRNMRLRSQLSYNQIMVNQGVNMSYFYMDMYSGTNVSLYSSYNWTENDVGRSSEMIGNYNYSSIRVAPYRNNWVNSLNFSMRLSPIKSIINLNLRYNRNEYNNFIGEAQYPYVTKEYSIGFFFISYFVDSWFNYEAGIDFSINNTVFSVSKLENKATRTIPYFNLLGEFAKHWSYSIKNALAYYQTQNTKRNFYQLDVELKYKKKTSKLSYWLSGNNITNIRNTQIAEVDATQNSISRSVIYQMPGYVGGGLSYDF